jgi:hypothetical protein
VFADAARAVDADLAEEIEREANWRKNYLRYVRALVEAGAASSKDALRIASDGLASLHNNLVFQREGEEATIDGAYETYRDPLFSSATVTGTGGGHRKLVIPVRDQLMSGDTLRAQLDRWEADSIIEPTCAESVRAVIDNPEWLDLRDHYIALLGAASEMGPLEALSSWGANIIAVDVPRPHVWQRIITIARSGSGTLHAPVRSPGATEETLDGEAGADLLTEGPEVRTWLESFDGPLTVMDLVYADGGNFVRLVASIDGLVTSMLDRRRDIALAYLGTPTDVYAVPAGTANAARRKERTGPLRTVMRGASRGRAYTSRYGNLINSEEGPAWGISDCIVPQQGPNYILAKNSQRWRACTAREEGIVTSANVAPATYTQSVVKNRLLKMAYGGAHAFGVHVFLPETSRALMAALLVHDLRNPQAIAQPSASLRHPFELHATGAAHGGIWTIPYEPRSVLPLAVVRGLPKIAMR